MRLGKTWGLLLTDFQWCARQQNAIFQTTTRPSGPRKKGVHMVRMGWGFTDVFLGPHFEFVICMLLLATCSMAEEVSQRVNLPDAEKVRIKMCFFYMWASNHRVWIACNFLLLMVELFDLRVWSSLTSKTAGKRSRKPSVFHLEVNLIMMAAQLQYHGMRPLSQMQPSVLSQTPKTPNV